MRLNILVLALLFSAASAEAGSIDVITTGTDAPRSIEKISCPTCVARPKKEVQSVVELAPGTQKIEVRDVDGVKKVYRTESWLGGSPVVFVSKALPDDATAIADAQADATDDVAAAPVTEAEKPAVSAEADMIDEKATTAAVAADMGAAVKAEVAPKVEAFDPSKLEFRVN
jgi:hypothetical protein